jgi:hypothetical protein
VSNNAGTSKKDEPFFKEVNGWKELTTISSTIEHLFALYEQSYEFLPGVAGALSKGTKAKLFLAVAKGHAFLVKYYARGQAAQVSEKVNLNLDLDPAERQRQETAARASADGVAALVDCGLFAATVAAGVYSGGIVVLFGGWLALAASGAKCLTSGVKWYQHSHGQAESWFDNGWGEVVDVGVTALDAATGLKAMFKTGKQTITYWRMAKESPIPRLAEHASHLMKLRLAKLGMVDIVGAGLTGYDLLTKVGGMIDGWRLQSILDAYAEEPPPCDYFEPMLRGPADWLRDTISNGFVQTPWSLECRK